MQNAHHNVPEPTVMFSDASFCPANNIPYSVFYKCYIAMVKDEGKNKILDDSDTSQ